MRKYSKQREAIKSYLHTHLTHPTAETVYADLRNEFPNISLGTVYRNLSLLSEIGEIQKITTGKGADRYDGDTSPHYHFICRCCGRIDDIRMNRADFLEQLADDGYDGEVDGHTVCFYGKCVHCKRSDAGNEAEPETK